MAEKKNILTYTGLKKYEDELHDLKVNKRQEIAQKIKEAREQGDLSEKISNESPVGRALLGKKAGETVDVETQAGIIQYKILDIRRVS